MRRQAPPTRRVPTMRRLLFIALVLAVAASATLLGGVAREGGEA
jgi:hypothetical protein